MPQTPTAGAAAAASPPTALGIGLVLLSFALGVGIDRVGATHRFNLLALPMLGMLAWNLAVYLLLAVPSWQRSLRTTSVGALDWVAARSAAGPAPTAGHRGTSSAAVTLTGWRVATMLHAAAATLALGAIASMYLRGLGVDYRAGWESTFLDAPTAHRVVTALLGPAAELGGTPLPNEAEFAALRGPAGHGESAARWIHWYAITIAGLVVVPRTLLAAWAAWRAGRLARAIAPPRRSQRSAPVAVRVLAYSHVLPPEHTNALRRALAGDSGGEPDVVAVVNVPLGGEDDLDHWLAADAAGHPSPLPIALFALTATPEHETHGAFIAALAERVPAAARPLVLVDEAGFRQRFGVARLEQRRDAWRRMVHEFQHKVRFVDLDPTAGTR